MAEVALQTLHVVAKELGLTLGEARQSLEAYAERPEDPSLLAACAERLHEVHGVLRLVEVYGAALLAEEMEQVARYLIEGAEDTPTAKGRVHPEGLDALMRAMVQLPAYLERVLGGGRDLALVLLPLLNDLRAVRGQALLSEGTLLLLNLTSDRQPQPLAPQPGEQPLNVAQWARRLRPRYQVGLLGWIKGERAAQHLEILQAVAERLEQVATRQPVFQLWWVVGSIVEALREGGLDGTATIKRLLGQADRELKRLFESGEARYAEAPPLDLLNNLLYYVARATTSGPRVSSVRASFKLQELLPVSEQVEQERESLSAPSVKLMQTVAQAIKEDLTRVKDVLDIFVRKGGAQVEELGAQLEMLRKIADTLGVLGLGGLRQNVQAQIQRLQEIVASRAAPPESVLIDIAAMLIGVEDNLDTQLVRLIMPNPGPGMAPEEDGEFRQVQHAVLRECIVNLARIKEVIAAIVARSEPTGADQVPQLLRGLTAGLLMLGRSRAVEITEAIARHVQDVLRPNTPLPQGRLDRLADAIVSIEYYMETVQSGRSDPWYMLDNAETCLRALDAEAEMAAGEPVLPELATAEPAAHAATVQLDRPAELPVTPTGTQILPVNPSLAAAFAGAALQSGAYGAGETPAGALEATSVALPMPMPAPAETPQVAAPTAAEAAPFDPELVALFVEEAREEIAKINQHFPTWDENPLDQDALVRVRRSFHTLKGSGRMVGARSIGEFAWSIENLLNRVISGTLARTPAMLALLRGAVATLPQLVDQLEHGHAPRADVGLLIARAQAFAEGRDPETVTPVELPPDPTLAALPVLRPEPVPVAPSPLDEASLIATEVLLSNDPALPKPLPPAARGASPVLEPPSRFVRVVDERERASDRDASRTPPPPPPSGSEFAMAGVGAVDEDVVLLEIYRKEVTSHVGAVRQWLRECEGRFPPFPVTEALHRACHTLAGASRMAEAKHGVRIAEPLNLYIRKLHDHGLGLSEAGRRVLAAAVDAMDEIVAHIDENTTYFSGHGELLAQLRWLDVDADREIQASGLKPVEPSEQSGPVSLHDGEMLAMDALLERTPPAPAPATAAEPIAATLLPSLGAEVAAQAERAPEPLAAPVAGTAAPTPGIAPVQEPAFVPPPAPAFQPPAAPADDHFDAEIAAIFSEEATELLDAADSELTALRVDPRDVDRVTELKRVLHTLKGGARMAGVTAMGDLAHEVESLLIQTAATGTSGDARTIDVLQASLDELHRMRETVGAGQPVAPAAALVERIHALYREPSTPPVLKTPAAEQPLPAPAAHVAATVAPAAPPAAPPVVKDIAGTGRIAVSTEAAAALTATAAAAAGNDDTQARPALRMPESASEAAPAGEDEALAGATSEALPEAEPEIAPAVEPLVASAPLEAEPAVERGPEPLAAFDAGPVLESALEPEPSELVADAPAVAATTQAPPALEPSFDTAVAAPTDAPDAVPSVAAQPESHVGEDSLQLGRSLQGEELLHSEQSVQGLRTLEQSRSIVLPPGREPQAPHERQELARVDAELLDSLLNNAGEVSIFRARLELQLSSVEFNLTELGRVTQRLKEQLRNLELETEAQILHKHGDVRRTSEFDPLELDQYSAIQQYSRALAESASDVASVQGLLESLANGLMRTRMVPFSRHVQRLTRIVRQVASETGKRAELVVTGASGELDRQVLERMLPPFEHMLRNSVVHGIESPAERVARGKPEAGRIDVNLKREGAEVVIVVADDGGGVNLRAVRDKALTLGMIDPKQTLTDEEAMQLILEPGFSTASAITQSAGRGVGMDVVATEIKKLGGALHMESAPGTGTRFTIRLPFTLAISQALIVRAADEMYALPLPTIEGVVRLPKAEVLKHLAEEAPTYEYGGQRYRFQHLGAFVGLGPSQLPEQDVPVPVVLIRAGEGSTALVTDELVGSREIVVKSVGPQISGIRGIAGATILGDGRIVIILDMGSLVRTDWRARPSVDVRDRVDRRTFALVVDDSITVRRVTQRLLERNGMRVMTAKDGADAIQIMQEHVPDVILLDIEMPRMDGYEVAAAVRGDPRLREVPIVMITSRVGEKHRARAIELGVDDYLGKPYQENQLLDAIEPLVMRRRATEAV
jgi:chemosensory pili system protein ChpA (sensor histidine kinase/response regulator)